jgi:hypothetical protein
MDKTITLPEVKNLISNFRRCADSLEANHKQIERFFGTEKSVLQSSLLRRFPVQFPLGSTSANPECELEALVPQTDILRENLSNIVRLLLMAQKAKAEKKDKEFTILSVVIHDKLAYAKELIYKTLTQPSRHDMFQGL